MNIDTSVRPSSNCTISKHTEAVYKSGSVTSFKFAFHLLVKISFEEKQEENVDMRSQSKNKTTSELACKSCIDLTRGATSSSFREEQF